MIKTYTTRDSAKRGLSRFVENNGKLLVDGLAPHISKYPDGKYGFDTRLILPKAVNRAKIVSHIPNTPITTQQVFYGFLVAAMVIAIIFASNYSR